MAFWVQKVLGAGAERLWQRHPGLQGQGPRREAACREEGGCWQAGGGWASWRNCLEGQLPASASSPWGRGLPRGGSCQKDLGSWFFPIKAFAALGPYCAFPTFNFTFCPNKVFSCCLIFPAIRCAFGQGNLEQELLRHPGKLSECVRAFFGRGQRKAASLVLGSTSSLPGSQHKGDAAL